ncbi:MAG: alpha-glucosidase/alpha-galactosidase, partial [Treponema sp.]|nr:alpha-glucosidase/alpha-galactosidase [Treponema sp.]
MAKIALIGAGSIVFCKTLLNDLFATPVLKGSQFALMGPTLWKLEKMKVYADQIIGKNHLDATVSCTTDRREALKGADYVILMFQIGGNDAYRFDYEIPMKYGVDQCIGDSMGPGGIFRCLRTAPVLIGIGNDIAELCPGAVVLNYVNPMGAVCTT